MPYWGAQPSLEDRIHAHAGASHAANFTLRPGDLLSANSWPRLSLRAPSMALTFFIGIASSMGPWFLCVVYSGVVMCLRGFGIRDQS